MTRRRRGLAMGGPLTQTIRGRLMVTAGAVVLFFALAGALSIWTARSVQSDYRRTVEIEDRLLENTLLRIRLMDDEETGVRGYLLTHNRRFLEPYVTAHAALPANQRQALRVAREEPSMVPLLRTTIHESQQWESWARQTLDHSPSGPTTAQAAVRQQTVGKRLSDRFRASAMRITSALGAHRARYYQRATNAFSRLVIELAALFLLLVGLVAGVGWHMIRAITRPLAQLQRATAAIARGAMHEPIDVTGPDELVALGGGMEEMRQELNRQRDRLEQTNAALKTSEVRFRTLVEGIDVGVLLVGADNKIVDANPAACSILGQPPEHLIGQDIQEGEYGVIREDGTDLPYQERAIGRVLKSSLPARNVLMGIYRTTDDVRWVLGNAEPILAEDGSLRQVIATLTDITERKAAEEALRTTEAELRDLHIGVMVFDTGGQILRHNPAAARLLGLEGTSLEGRDLDASVTLLGDNGLPLCPEKRPLDVTLRTGKAIHDAVIGIDLPWMRERRWLLVNTRPQFGVTGELVAVLSTFTDITERKRLEEQLRHQALHDPLTDLPNRVLLLDRLEQAIRVSERRGVNVSLLLLDLNRFKEINDTFGHHHGDLLLQQIGPRLRGLLRRSDTIARLESAEGPAVARLGGDEFALILPDAGVCAATQVADRIIGELRRPFVIAGENVDLGVSVGIAVYPCHGETPHLLLQHADVAMYAAKHGAKGFAVYEAEHDPYTAARLARISDLHRAVERGGLELYYQPKADLASGRVLGAEALVRWYHPQEGFIPPPEIIELAEHTGLIRPLTEWVLNTATHQCRVWWDAGLALTVSVNISPRSLQDHQFVDIVQEALRQSDVPASSLVLEVTESAVMVDPERASEVITRLDALGIAVSIDDFGTGYSSLSYLKRLPADELKIDKSFVMDLDKDDENRFIVRAAVSLAHDLGLMTVAEGIESQRVWEMLAELGCDRAQGYHLARPMPPADFMDWVEARQATAKLA